MSSFLETYLTRHNKTEPDCVAFRNKSWHPRLFTSPKSLCCGLWKNDLTLTVEAGLTIVAMKLIALRKVIFLAGPELIPCSEAMQQVECTPVNLPKQLEHNRKRNYYFSADDNSK